MTLLAWLVGLPCAAAFIGGACAAVLNRYHQRIEEDMRRRDADILRTIRPTVDHSPGPVGDAEAP